MDTHGEIIIYQTEDGLTKINVNMQNETVWLSKAQMAELFQRDRSVISKHIKNVFEEGELSRESNVQILHVANSDKPVEFYNLDVIISVGYRVKSQRGVQFRIWATSVLKEYMIKGFAMDDERLKGNGGGNYWKELLDRIRDIRSSEKVLYRQVLDLYATSVDYNPHSEESIRFFKIVQNKLHFAAHGHTAAEVIYERANAEKPFMGLTSFSGELPAFFVFDYCNNFEYFDLHPDGKDPSTPLNLNQKIYSLRLDVLSKLQNIEYQEQPEYKAYHSKLKNMLIDKIANLDIDRIDVKPKLYYVDKYKKASAFDYLSDKNIYEIKTQLLKLIDQDTTDDNYSKSFDYRVSIIQLSLLDDTVDSSRQQGQLLKTAQALLAKASIQDIFDKRHILKQLADEDYYTDLDFFKLERVKEEVGPLIKYLRGEPDGDKISNFNDKIETKERDVKYDFDNFKTYREKIITYLQKHFGELESVKKIINLDELNSNDLNELQTVLDLLKTPETSIEEEFTSTQELIIFIRKIVGLDKKAIDEKCAKFLNINDFNKEQRQLINLIIDFAIRNGNVTKDDLVNTEPFSDIEIPELFDNELAPILQLVAMFTNPLNVAA